MANTRRADMRFDEETISLLSQLSEHLGINKTSVVKQAVRELARKEGLIMAKPYRYDQMTLEELVEEYNELERKLYGMGRDYEQIPEGTFDIIEGWIESKGGCLEHPKVGLATLKKLD